jgi:hypothetical protein
MKNETKNSKSIEELTKVVSIPLRGKGYEKHRPKPGRVLYRGVWASVSIPLRGKGYEKHLQYGRSGWLREFPSPCGEKVMKNFFL